MGNAVFTITISYDRKHGPNLGELDYRLMNNERDCEKSIEDELMGNLQTGGGQKLEAFRRGWEHGLKCANGGDRQLINVSRLMETRRNGPVANAIIRIMGREIVFEKAVIRISAPW